MSKDSDAFLLVSELFSSIQGESTFAGCPCFFIRLSGCNLDCRFCDTHHAQNSSTGKRQSVPELVKAAKEAALPLVEITGGEPLLQNATPELCSALIAAKFTVLVETNGSIPAGNLPDETIRIFDFKTPSSGESEKMCLDNFRTLRSHDQVKFVLASRGDYEQAIETIRRFKIDKQTPNVLFSPVWGELEPELLAEWILKDKVSARLQIQLHKIIWGPLAQGV
ncbi:MAG: hypothetical protein A2X49_15560 [Lentisphaerae bacterium GWF2_52_8]|nr:MAG: hypothetical protein A2X49_15560 [Lentisphaerae bacterium GWF2_52_8]